MQTRAPLRHGRGGALGLGVSLVAACTQLVGVPVDAGAGHDAAPADTSSLCGIPMTGHAPGERDETLGEQVDPRLDALFVKGAAQDALGRVYVYGTMYGCREPGTSTDAAVLRFTEDGMLDPSFGDRGFACPYRVPGDPLHYAAYSLAIDSRGRVVLAGLYYVSVQRPQPGVAVARLDEQGQVDTTFGTNGLLRLPIGLERGAMSASCYAVLAEDDGLVLAGAETDPFGNSTYGFITRLREDGTTDPSFHRGEVRFDTSTWAFSSILRAPQGYAVVGSTRAEYRPRVLMLGRDGEPVTSFGADGVATHTYRDVLARGLALDPSGGFIVAGEFRDSRSAALVRFSDRGVLDPNFGIDQGLSLPGVPWFATAQLAPVLARQCDGRLLVAGSAGAPGFTLARIDSNGRRDPRFGNGGSVRVTSPGVNPSYVYAVLVHPVDGRITVVTSFSFDHDVALWRFWP